MIITTVVSKMSKKAKLQIIQDIQTFLDEKQIEIDKCIKDYGIDHESTKRVTAEWFGMVAMSQQLTGLRV